MFILLIVCVIMPARLAEESSVVFWPTEEDVDCTNLAGRFFCHAGEGPSVHQLALTSHGFERFWREETSCRLCCTQDAEELCCEVACELARCKVTHCRRFTW